MQKGRLHSVILFFTAFIAAGSSLSAQTIVASQPATNTYLLGDASICVDVNDDATVQLAASFLQQDLEAVTGKRPELKTSLNGCTGNVIIIGSLEKSAIIRQWVNQKKIKVDQLKGKWEAYQLISVANPAKGIANALVITGSDRRGTAFGVFELSKQLGVSPWYWWADVPVRKKTEILIKRGVVSDAPKVKYRGIFINDEAPCLSNWSKEKFGGFKHQFYAKVFELMLRLKANYLWPAMWGNAFYYDDSLNIKTADEYGIVIGTSHHEPLMRAHEEWKYFGKGKKWNYDSTESGLKEFWKGGMERAWNEKIVSVGMRGDGDAPMSRETATTLLERIVKDQREIIAAVTGKPASETPQLWALYKEVQDYYDKGMRVPDDVTLLLCDDNWGNIRKLPKITDPPRKGGYGIYYHFDYVGGPRNYKWINTNPLPKIWEQMHLAWEHAVKDIWIVNVGDIKPMEFPISFWCDYAWNPDRIGPADLQKYTEQWAAAQFGATHAIEIARILSAYGKYNSIRKPELLDANTFSLVNYNEFRERLNAWQLLANEAEILGNKLPANTSDAYFQLVLHPVKAMCNLYELYWFTAMNHLYYRTVRNTRVNEYAQLARNSFVKDSMITLAYHQLGNGKWNHMMSQTHIGYTSWQQPPVNRMPLLKTLPEDSVRQVDEDIITPVYTSAIGQIPVGTSHPVFYELQQSGVSIEASHFTKAVNSNGIRWTILPDHGRTGSAVTPFPVTASPQTPGGRAPQLEYEIYTYSKDSLKLMAYFSPSLNFYNATEGLQYAVSIDDEAPQIMSINKEDKNSISGIWNKWVSENIIIKTTKHRIEKPGKHIVRYWMVTPAVVLQKLVLDFGETKPSYLGPPETKAK